MGAPRASSVQPRARKARGRKAGGWDTLAPSPPPPRRVRSPSARAPSPARAPALERAPRQVLGHLRRRGRESGGRRADGARVVGACRRGFGEGGGRRECSRCREGAGRRECSRCREGAGGRECSRCREGAGRRECSRCREGAGRRECSRCREGAGGRECFRRREGAGGRDYMAGKGAPPFTTMSARYSSSLEARTLTWPSNLGEGGARDEKYGGLWGRWGRRPQGAGSTARGFGQRRAAQACIWAPLRCNCSFSPRPHATLTPVHCY
jgi:hypothetical protein